MPITREQALQALRKVGFFALGPAIESREVLRQFIEQSPAHPRALERWLNPSHIKLHAGEMSAQELRTVQAVVRAIIADSPPAHHQGVSIAPGVEASDSDAWHCLKHDGVALPDGGEQ